MIDSILQSLNIYSNYELLYLVLSLDALVIGLALYAHFHLSEWKVTLLPVVSGVIVTIVTLGLLYVGNEYFEVITNGYNQITLVISSVLVLLSTLIYIESYRAESFEKKPDVDHVNRHHFRSVIDFSATLLILGATFGFFTSDALGQTIILTVISSIVSLGLLHFYIRRVYVDRG